MKNRNREKETVCVEKKPKKWLKITAVIFCTLLILFLLFLVISPIVGLVGTTVNMQNILKIEPIGSRLDPIYDRQNESWTFVTDDEFKILQLSDIHIGNGYSSFGKDNLAVNAVVELVGRAKPDLVVLTGDMVFPFWTLTGSRDNLRQTQLIATVMEKLDVYWTVVLGNHDSEKTAMYDRESIASFYETCKKCLFSKGDSAVDGMGNYTINVKNSSGMITQSLFMFDSHAYGTNTTYANMTQSQMDFHVERVGAFSAYNNAIEEGKGIVKSLAFFHIPVSEYRDAWNEYVDAGRKNTDNVIYHYGDVKESVSCGDEDNVFETFLQAGSVQGIFCGHDHVNTFSLTYKGIRLTYGWSIDYLAYIGIMGKTEQRGGTVITISPDGSFDCYGEKLAV